MCDFNIIVPYIKIICNIASSVLFTLIYYPQIKRLIRTNETKAFSINYLKICLVAYLFYTVFLILEGLYILLVSSLINTLCIIYMYHKKRKNIKEKKRIKEEMNKELKEKHNILIIS